MKNNRQQVLLDNQEQELIINLDNEYSLTKISNEDLTGQFEIYLTGDEYYTFKNPRIVESKGLYELRLDVKNSTERNITKCSNDNCSLVYYQYYPIPSELKVTDAKSNSSLNLTKAISDYSKSGSPKTSGLDSFSYSFSKTTQWFKLGNSSILVIPSTSYNSTDINLTQQTGLVHLSVNDTSLALYMPFDFNGSSNTFYDYSYWKLGGSCSGSGCPPQSLGKFGNAYTFDGVNDGITISNRANLKATNQTIAFWVKLNTTATNRIISKGGVSGYVVRYTNGGGAMELVTVGGCGTFFTSNNSITTSAWEFWTVTMDASGCKFYKSGIDAGVTTSTYVPTSDTSPLTISLDSDSFNGSIDDLMIFNRTLSRSEILSIYNNQSNRFNNEGFMNFTNRTLDSSDNLVNVSIANISMLMSSNLSASADNGATWRYFNTNGNATDIPLTNPTTANITIRFQTNSTYTFYSPLVGGNITLYGYSVSGANLTCTTSYNSGTGEYYIPQGCQCYYQGNEIYLNPSLMSCIAV